MQTVYPSDVRLARALAFRFANGKQDDDLESAAMLGLVEAAGRWDEALNVPWTAYMRRCCESRLVDELRRRGRRLVHEITTAPEDLPDTQAPDLAITNPDLDIALTRLPAYVEVCFRAGDIDQRRPAHRAAIITIKEALS